MSKKPIYCHHCKEPILSKEELAVVGNSFIPYHNSCFESIKHKNIYAFYSGYKTNGIFPWILMILLNSAIWAAFFWLHPPLDEVIVMSAALTGFMLIFRLLSYILYERHYNA